MEITINYYIIIITINDIIIIEIGRTACGRHPSEWSAAVPAKGQPRDVDIYIYIYI